MAAVIVCSSTALEGQGAPKEGRLVVESQRIRIADIEPGSRWLLMAFGRELSSPVSVRGYFQWHSLEDSTRTGQVDLDLSEKPTPPLSVWAAFEVSSGRLLTARPTGPAPSTAAKDLAIGRDASLADLAASEALLFLLRRGKGGWVWTGEADVVNSRPDGLSVLLPQPEHFVPISGESPSAEPEPFLEDFLPEDLFLAIDQRTLTLTVSRVR
jgi:hypothetical protein